MSTVWPPLHCPWVYREDRSYPQTKYRAVKKKKKTKLVERKSPCVFKYIRNNKFYLAKEKNSFQIVYNSNGHFE